jgi:hydroxymethylpyrimidine pyrophosphatase-like HAD family hydrolase
MRFLALACDYDGTLATDGVVQTTTVAALEQLRASGRRLILVTGRQFDDLAHVFQRLDLFDRVVAENGAVVIDTHAPDRPEVLAQRPPQAFVKSLREHGVPCSVGSAIVATVRPYETTVLEVIRELCLEMEIIFNKDAVMVLPTGTTKCTGLAAALEELQLSLHNMVGVGDGENDHAFLRASECAVAVANAVPALKQIADWTTRGARGKGVEELIERLLADDLAFLEPRLSRHAILLGRTARNRKPVLLRPYGTRLLMTGSSKAGKSSLTLGILERLTQADYQYCLIHPGGDYEAMPGAINLGTEDRAPDIAEVLEVLERPDQSAVVSLLALPLEERPRYFAGLLARLEDLRVGTARPHWLIVDEVHHALPADWAGIEQVVPQSFGGLVMIGLNPQRLNIAALRLVETVCAVGEAPARTLHEFCKLVGAAAPSASERDLEKGQALLWRLGEKRARLIQVEPSTIDRKRHRRKYAEGELPPDRSFYFRGPKQRLRLRAHNLSQFLELADGVDDATWLHHLRADDYSKWVRSEVKSDDLADRIADIERNERLSATESREAIRRAIEEQFAPPA